MVWKNSNALGILGAIFIALLLASPVGFAATSAESAPINRVPVISGVGGPTNINVNAQGTWSITASDPEGGPLTYNVVWGDEGSVKRSPVSSTSQTATFTHIYYAAGTYTVIFTVTDSAGATAQSTITVNVQQPSDTTPPAVSTSNSASADANNGVVAISASASDASGISEIKIYTAKGYLDGHSPYVLVKTCSAATSCTYTSGYGAGTYTYYATAKDASALRNEGKSAEQTFTITAPPTNRAPTISSLSGSQNLKVGETGTWKIVASDPEGGPLTYAVKWGDENLKGSASAPQTMSVGQTATFTHIYYSAGVFTPSFTVTDDKGASAGSSIGVAVGAVQDGPDTQIKSGVTNMGQVLDAGEIKVRFKDFTQPSNYVPAPVFDILNANDAVVASPTIETKTYYKYTAPSGTSYLVYVEEFGMGFSLNAKWTKVRIYKVNGSPDPLSTIQAADEKNPSTDGGSPADSFLKVGALNIGQVLDVGSIKIRLADIGMEKPEAGSALVDVLDQNDLVIKQMAVQLGSFRVVSYGGTTYAVYAEETAGGTTLNARWAKLRVYRVNGLPDVSGYKPDVGGSPPSGSTMVASGTPTIGQSLSFSNYKARLQDVSVFPRNQGFTNKPAIIELLDSNDAVVAMRTVPVNAGFMYSSGSAKYYIYVTGTQVLAYDPGNSYANLKIYSVSGSTNMAPTISGFSPPSALQVGETGTWKITASDPEGGALTYTVVWGDEAKLSKQPLKGTLSAGQTATFQHIYYAAGTYTPTFTVSDAQGASAQASASVNVGPTEQPPSTKGTIKLYKGWNQISVPVNAKVSMEDVAAKCNSKPYAWRLSESGYSKDRTLVPGYGYWIKSNGDCEYSVTSASNSPYGLASLFAGWNLVGAPGRAVSISDYAGSCTISQGPWYYSYGVAESATSKPQYILSSALEPGRAYWIYADSACRLGGEDEPPAPPATS